MNADTPKGGRAMTADPNVDRQLGELWLISEILTNDVRNDITSMRAEAARWEPAPCPDRKEFQ